MNAEVERIQLGVWRERDANPVKAEPHFVNDCGAEGVCFIEREDLPARLPRVAEAGNRVSLKCRFTAFVTLNRVVAVQTVVDSKRGVQGPGPLIDVDRRGR